MNNLEIYNKVAAVPKNAQKTITAGRLKGMTDINPMWRIKMLTEIFGMCGAGWKYTITDKRIVEGADGVVCRSAAGASERIPFYSCDLAEAARALKDKGYSVEDVGTYTPDSCNYPDIAHALCVKLQNHEADEGVLICGTGIGMSIAANKHKGIRAAVCSDTFSARLTKEHNDTNVICFGARVVGQGLACDIVDQFLEAEFMGGKHAVRVDMINALEK